RCRALRCRFPARPPASDPLRASSPGLVIGPPCTPSALRNPCSSVAIPGASTLVGCPSGILPPLGHRTSLHSVRFAESVQFGGDSRRPTLVGLPVSRARRRAAARDERRPVVSPSSSA